jgi:hypothetical protein
MAGADRVAVDPLGGDLRPAAPLQRLVDPQEQRAGGHEGGHQQPEQNAAGGQAGPARPVEHPMVAPEAPVLRQAHDPQGRRDRAPAGGEEGTGEQNQGVLPDAAGEQWRERRKQG